MAGFSAIVTFLFVFVGSAISIPSITFFSTFISPMAGFSAIVAFIRSLWASRVSSRRSFLLTCRLNNYLLALEGFSIHLIGSLISISIIIEFDKGISVLEEDFSDFAVLFE